MKEQLGVLESGSRWGAVWTIRRVVLWSLVLLLAMLVTACGSGGGSQDDPNQISRIEVTPGTALMTSLGETYQLKATAYDANGEPLNVNFDWTSSNPGLMTVDGQGTVTTHDYAGSSLISATAGDVSGQATLLAVELMPNSVLVSDAQVLDNPLLQDPDTPPDVGSLYEVTLDGTVAVTVGDILLASESAPIGGRVVDVVRSGTSQLVTLELIPVSQMFSKLKIDETYHFTTDDAVIPEEISTLFDVSENPDGSLKFTPKPEFSNPKTMADNMRQALGTPQGTFANPYAPFDCSSTMPTIPLTLNLLPVTDGLVFDLDLIMQYDSDNEHLQKLALAGMAKAELRVRPSLNVAFEGKFTCTLDVVSIPIPISGAASVVFGGRIPVGPGFEIGGRVTLGQVAAEANFKAQFNAEVGVERNAMGELELIDTAATATSQSDADFRLILPDTNNLTAGLRFEPTLKGFAFADFRVGTGLFYRLEFKALRLTGGLVESANLATVDSQVAGTTYASSYMQALNINAGFGRSAIQFFNFLNINAASFSLVNLDIPLYTSPRLQSASADVASFATGDTVNFNVVLMPNTLDYRSYTSSELYNIDEIIIYRRIDNGGAISTQEIARTGASFGQSSFDLSWTADSDGDIGSDFFVFVDTKALSIPFTQGQLGIPWLDELELGTVAGNSIQPVTRDGISARLRFPDESQYINGEGSGTLSDNYYYAGNSGINEDSGEATLSWDEVVDPATDELQGWSFHFDGQLLALSNDVSFSHRVYAQSEFGVSFTLTEPMTLSINGSGAGEGLDLSVALRSSSSGTSTTLFETDNGSAINYSGELPAGSYYVRLEGNMEAFMPSGPAGSATASGSMDIEISFE